MIKLLTISAKGVTTLEDTPENLYNLIKPQIDSDEKWLFKDSQLVSKSDISPEIFTEGSSYSLMDALIGG